jgi:hypothetical protein
MRRILVSFCGVLLAVFLHAQTHIRNANDAALKAAKNATISTFDSALPSISLEYFLKYESKGVPIDWTIVTCDERAINPVIDRQDRMNATGDEGDRPLCVQATVDDVRAQRSAVVVVQVGTIGAGAVGKPKLHLVMADDERGVTRRIQLIELPAVMQRWRRTKLWHGPRDLPQRLGIAA